ncbi:MAG: TPM domain-containing protein [Planctomycetia bacterium]|nr:TPM domain-containing protein [Candidatus Brocadia sp.]QOJ06127.1 MAG: TPM domain-containing protein [Planctomycetia bacterium]HQU30500.1 TPM domain-containing protein [Candidatus Brocadia sapporoensis]
MEDRANIIDDAVENGLNGYFQELEQKTGVQMVVFTVDTTGDIPIETYAIELATKWKLGQKGKDNGVLVVIARNDRAYRIEVGYGLEGVLPDSFCGTIGRTYFVPNFQKGHFSEGIFQGMIIMVHKIAEESGIKITGMPDISKVRKKSAERQNPFHSLLFLLVILPVFISYLFNRRRRSSYWWGGPPIIYGGPRDFGSGGSGGFGGFGGGGGGSFGGGGASGRW